MKKRSSKKSDEQVGIVEEIVNEAYCLRKKGEMMGDSYNNVLAGEDE